MYLDYTSPPPPKNLVNPPGFAVSTKDKDVKSSKPVKQPNPTELKLKRAWEVAFAPAKTVPMQAVMLYFSGSGVQIFSLGMIFMLLTGPISAVAGLLRTFEPFRTPRADGELTYALLIPPMFVYVLCQAGTLALGLYKCWTMGILPTGASDWLQFETRPDAPEWSAIRGMILGR